MGRSKFFLDKVLYCIFILGITSILWCLYFMISENNHLNKIILSNQKLYSAINFDDAENNYNSTNSIYLDSLDDTLQASISQLTHIIPQKLANEFSSENIDAKQDESEKTANITSINDTGINDFEIIKNSSITVCNDTYEDEAYQDNVYESTKDSERISDNFGFISLEDKKKLEEQNPEKIAQIDSVYKFYPVNKILKDIFPWDNYSAEIELKSELLDIDNIVLDKNTSCIPFSYGYSNELAEKVFKKRRFADCSGNITNPVNNIHKIGYCKNSVPSYVLGGNRNNQLLGSSKIIYPWEMAMVNEIPFEDNEYLFVKCQSQIKKVIRVNHFSADSSSRSKMITEKIESILKIAKNKPIGIYVFMLDSVSRKHFYRNLKSAISYLNSQISQTPSDIMVYDFLINNAQGYYTTSNLIPILFGKSLETQEDITKDLDRKNPKDGKVFKYLQEHMLLKFYERLGYVTAFEWDTVRDNFNNLAGSRIYADHTPVGFWDAVKKIFRYDDFISRNKCFGGTNYFEYVFDYLIQFNKNYKEHNRFGYFHLSIGHEGTGTHIEYMNEGFKNFLSNFFNYYRESDEDFVLMISGDHGRGLEEWDSNFEGIFEQELPIHLLITNERIMKKFGKEAHENLIHNTKRLVTRSDWHTTLKHLALIPYGNLELGSETYEKFQNDSVSNKGVSLFLEKIPDNRACEDYLIPKLFCSCRNYENITSEAIRKAAIQNVNDTIKMLSFLRRDTYPCDQLTLNEILSAEIVTLKIMGASRSFLVKIIATIIQDPNVKIEFSLIAAEYRQFAGYTKRKALKTPITNFTLVTETDQLNSKAQVLKISILDRHICKYFNPVIEITDISGSLEENHI